MDSPKLLELYSYSDPTYENFIGFVRRYIAPHMQMRFVEEEYYRKLWEDQWKHRRNDDQISRGHSKSELLVCWGTIYFASIQPNNPFFEKVHGRRKKVIEQLVTSSDNTAVGELRDRIHYYFQADDTLVQLMPKSMDDDKWNSEKMMLRNGSIIHFRSVKCKRGLHVDRIVCDDLTTESSTLSDEETWSFFTGAILPMGTAKVAMVLVDGTPIRITDIMSQLSKKEGWNHTKLPAIIDYDTQKILSPNRFTWDLLMDVKRDIGSVKFEAEYMLNPIDDSVSLIKSEWVRACYNPSFDLFRHRAFFTEVYLGVDFAFSDRKTADWSVFFILGRHNDQFYMLDYIRKQGMSGTEQLSFIRELHTVYHFDMIGLEDNSIQAIVKEVRELNLPVKLFHTGNVDEKDKRSPDFSKTLSVSKRNLVLRLGTTFENHSIIIPYKSDEAKRKADQLLNECTSWAQEEGKLVEMGIHPDVPIGLGYALEVATKNNSVIEFAMG